MTDKKLLKGYIYVISSAIVYSFMPMLAKLVYSDGVNPLTLVFLRNVLSLPAIFALAKLNGASLKLQREQLPMLFVIAVVGFCGTSTLIFSAYQYMDTGIVTVIHFIYPAVVMVLEALLFKAGIKKNNVIGLVLCIVGICMFYTPGKSYSLIGSTLALLSGVTYAIYIVFLVAMRHRSISGYAVNFYVALICSVVMLALCLLSGQLVLPVSARGWVYAFAFALIINAGAVVLFQKGAFIIGGQRSAILSTFEPAGCVLVGCLFLGESIGLASGAGVVLVLASVFVILKTSKQN